MIDKIRKSFNTGLNRIKWIATFIAERTKAETSVAKLLYESSKLENKIDDLYRDIGKRILELKDKDNEAERDVFKDFIIQQAIDEIKSLKETVEDYKSQARDINKLPE
jgi:predicted RNase H-like nuclease (RuvC/YqgF family)